MELFTFLSIFFYQQDPVPFIPKVFIMFYCASEPLKVKATLQVSKSRKTSDNFLEHNYMNNSRGHKRIGTPSTEEKTSNLNVNMSCKRLLTRSKSISYTYQQKSDTWRRKATGVLSHIRPDFMSHLTRCQCFKSKKLFRFLIIRDSGNWIWWRRFIRWRFFAHCFYYEIDIRND